MTIAFSASASSQVGYPKVAQARPSIGSMASRLSVCLAPAGAMIRGVAWGFHPAAATRHFASSRNAREASLAKAYLQGYIKATQEGNVQDAIHYLEKANEAAGYVHIRLQSHQRSRTMMQVPLAAIIPTFNSNPNSPRLVLPFTVDTRNEEEMPIPEVISEDNCPKQIIFQ